MRILWHSNAPWSSTGYGNQTGLFCPLLAELGHELAISAFWGLGGKRLEWGGMPIYPSDDEWGNRWLPGAAAHWGDGDPSAVTVITLMDVWVLTGQVLSELRMGSWVPVDHDPLPPRVLEFFVRTGSVPIAMSRFGARMLERAGLDPLYVPHGADTRLLRPIAQETVREALGMPADAFVVGMVAANKGNAPPRKAFPQVFQAFAQLHRRHPDSLLYLHTAKTAGAAGLNLLALLEVCGVPLDAVRWTPEFELYMGVEYEKMAWVYSCFDVLANPSYGEGFGLPIVDAQACGVPVIVTDFSAMPELVGAGWKVSGEPWYDASQGAWFCSPRVGDIVDALEAAYDSRGQHGDQARAFAERYDTRLVTEQYWAPALEQLDRRLRERRVIRPVAIEEGLNRARRRARRRRRART